MQFPQQVTGSPWESKQPWLLSYVDSEWSVSLQIHKELVNVFQSLNENAIILYRCLLHSLHCGSGCSYLDFIGFVFFFLFHNFFGPKELFSSFLFFSFFSLWHSWLCCPGIWNTLYFSPTRAHPALQSNRHCLLNYEVPSHSLTQSLT